MRALPRLHRRLARRDGFTVLVLLAVSSASALAPADGPGAPTDEQRAAARILGTDGVRLAMAGDCAGAVDKLTRAEALVHAPTTAVPLGECQIKLGKIVAGTEILNRILHEPLAANAPPSWIDAKRRAQPILDAALPRIAQLRIHVDRPAGTTGDPTVTVDGESLVAVLLDNARPTDPGAHHIEAKQAGLLAASTDVTLGEGESKSVTLRLEAGAMPAPVPSTSSTGAPSPTVPGASVAPTGTTQPPPAPERPPPSPPNRVPGIIVLGLGGAGLAVGTVFGVMALGNKSSLDKACDSGKVCPATAQSDIDSMHTSSLVSTIGFVAGVVGVGLGAYMLLSAKSDDGPLPTAKRGVTVHPWVGLGSVGLRGSFE